MPSEAGSSRVFGAEVQQKYSSAVGLIYVFNLIVGTGALTLPGAFSRAGWALGLSFIILLAFISFMTVTFIVEAMSIGNAILVGRRKREKDSLEESPSESRILQSSTSRRERDPLIPTSRFGEDSEDLRFRSVSARSPFEINQRLELGRMASMFLGRFGLYLFYLCLAIYLYGDLAIYIAAVAKSLRDVACTYVPPSNSTNGTDVLSDDTLCWSELADGVTRLGAYRIFSILFLLALGPFCFFNVTKTKHLQLFTSTMRWTAFLLMIGIATNRIVVGTDTGNPIPVKLSSLPNLFGICVYSFMCHHSLPSLITPFASKRKIYSLLAADYLLITIFYLLLALTGVFAFNQIQDLYTLNFEPNHSGDIGLFAIFIQYFLSLFPVFTLSTNFPIIAITLRNNLKSLFQIVDEEDEDLGEDGESEDESGTLGYPPLNATLTHRQVSPQPPSTICCTLLSKAGFPLLAILPPFLVALLVEDIQFLVGVTGSYAGAGIQYVTPALLVLNARKHRQQRVSSELNPYTSPFRHVFWVWLVLIWAVVSISFITVHRFLVTEA